MNDNLGEEVEGARCNLTRRYLLATAGVATVGGVLAGTALAAGGKDPGKDAAPAAAPPLPWTWQKIDPMDAGRNAYRNYHEKGG